MIVATAGHVDHGKTSLVRALTGVDTDRLPEEKRRGMSIDVGFAHLEGDTRIGFVDVPGHERFVANLLAGISGVDAALLVVAADDGPMPQTREHLTLLGGLGVARCIVALTKVDRVDAGRQAAARREIDALLGTGPFAGAPVFEVVAPTGAGVAALRRALDGLAATLPARRAAGAFRLAVDRSFLRAGSGRVVTGAVLSGRVRIGDRLVVSSDGAGWRVRGVQVHGVPTESAAAGERCAINLVGADAKAAKPERGDWLVAPAVHAPTDRLDVRLGAARTASRALPVHVGGLQLHLGAAAVGVRVALLGGEALAAGEAGFAQLVLDRPVSALHGDRFVLRDPAAGACIAAGRVVDPFAAARGRTTPGRIAGLKALERASAADALEARLSIAGVAGVDLDRFVLARNLDPAEAESLARRPALRVVATAAGRRAIGAPHWQALQDRLDTVLRDWHGAQPDSVGPAEPALAAQLGRPAAPLLRAALGAMVADGRVAAVGFRWRLAGHRPVLSAADTALLERIAAQLGPSGCKPPIVGELATALGIAQADLLAALARAGQVGALVRVAPNRWFLPETVAELAAQALALAAETPDGFDAGAYRDRTGIGRNLTVQVLEFLDREGVTRFDGRRRFVRR